MRTFLALALALPAAAGEPLDAHLEEGRHSVRIRIDPAGLPSRARLSVRVLREVSTLKPGGEVVLAETLLPLDSLRAGEGVIEVGKALETPGRYRIAASFEEAGQYPEVQEALKKLKPAPREAFLTSDLLDPAYLRSVLGEEAWLASSLKEVGAFVERMNGLEALSAADRPKGAEAWKSWHPAAAKGMQALATRGRDVQDRLFPETCRALFADLVQAGLITMELRKSQNASTGEPWRRTGFLKGHETFTVKDLDPYEALFHRESLWYRLQVLKALASEAQAGRAGRKRWDAVLALIGPEDPAAPAAKRMAEWLDDPSDARKRALEEAYAALEAKLKSGS